MSDDRQRQEREIEHMTRMLDAWNRADARATASYYAEEVEYRDPSVPDGIHGRRDLEKYLGLIFKLWPEQHWEVTELFPHKKPGAYSCSYTFRIANDNTEITGHGIDRLEFTGGKVSLNHVYLNAGKWNDWLKSELRR